MIAVTTQVRITRRHRPQRRRWTEDHEALDAVQPTPPTEDLQRLRCATDALLERIDEALVE